MTLTVCVSVPRLPDAKIFRQNFLYLVRICLLPYSVCHEKVLTLLPSLYRPEISPTPVTLLSSRLLDSFVSFGVREKL